MNIGVNARILLSDHMEGVARYIYETTRHMAMAHPDDTFFLFFDRKVSAHFVFPANVIKIVVPLQARHPILWHIWFEYLLPVFFYTYKIDVFYSGDGYLSLRTKIPTVLVTHDLAYIHFPEHIPYLALKHYQKYIPRYHDKAVSIIAVSEFVKNDIQKQFNISTDKIHVAYNAVSEHLPDYDDVIPENLLRNISDDPYFIYLGSLHPRKNIERLIDGFNQFLLQTDKQYKLILCGRLAWKSDEIRKKIAQSKAVIHSGPISETTKYKLIKKAEALVYISLFEGFGIPILEAMKTGTPVITASITSMPEVADNAAILVNPYDVPAISEAFIKISTDIKLKEELISRGNERCKMFNWSKSSEIIYNQLLKAKNK